MAVGDAIVVLGADNSVLTLQPAAGVEILLTASIGTGANTQALRITNGTAHTYNDVGSTVSVNTTQSGAHGHQLNLKVFITNSLFARVEAMGAGNRHAFSGVETK